MKPLPGDGLDMAPFPDRTRLERFLTITLLAAVAVAQPLLDLLGRQAEFLVAHGLTAAGLVAFAIVLSLLLPAAAAALPLLLGRLGRGAGAAAFHLLFVLLSSLVALQALRAAPAPGALLLAAALAIALTANLAFRRFAAVRLFFRYLSPAVLVFPVVFLFFSRATPMLLQGPEPGPGERVPIGAPHDVVVLVLDEFPLVSLLTGDLEINRERFPNFARLAAMSTWYRGAATDAETTVGAVPSLLSGLRPDPAHEDLPITANFPRNLFTLLQGDYRMNASETATRLCPGDLCSGRAQPARRETRGATLLRDLALVYLHLVAPAPWSASLPSVSHGWTGFDGASDPIPEEPANGRGLDQARALAELSRNVSWGTRAAEVDAFIASIEAGDTPRLHYLHTLLPHAIWRYLPDGRQYLLDEDWEAIRRNAGPGISDVWHDDAFAVRQQWQRHLLQVGYVDTLLGRLLDRMEREGVLDDALLIVAGDHGTSFAPGRPRRTITAETWSDIAAVPLLVHFPGQAAGVVDDRPATLADVLPTVADVLEAVPGWPFDGVSLLGPPPARDTFQVALKQGGAATRAVEAHRRHLEARAGELEAVFGRTWPELFRIGPRDELLGTSPGDWDRAALPGLTVDLAGAYLLQGFEPGSPFVPRQVKGVVAGRPDAGPPLELAIAVNGEIRATTRTLLMDPYRDAFSAMLPEDSLHAGDNTVQVYLVGHGAGGTSLAELGGTAGSAGWALADRDGKTVLLGSDGALPVSPAPFPFTAASAQVETGGLVSLAGVANNAVAGNAMVLAFLDGRFAGSSAVAGRAYSIAVSPGARDSLATVGARVFLVDASSGTGFEAAYPAACSPQWLFAPPASWSGTDCSAQAGTPLVALDGRYAAELDLAQPLVRQYLGDGWGAESGGIAWSVGKSARIGIPLPPGLRRLSLTATVKPFLHPPGLAAQHLWVTANGLPAGSWVLQENRFEKITVEVPAAVLQAGPRELVLEWFLPDAAPPKSVGAGEDLRALGIALRRVEITAL